MRVTSGWMSVNHHCLNFPKLYELPWQQQLKQMTTNITITQVKWENSSFKVQIVSTILLTFTANRTNLIKSRANLYTTASLKELVIYIYIYIYI